MTGEKVLNPIESEQPYGMQNGISPTFTRSLAEASLGNPLIHKNLIELGFVQFTPPSANFKKTLPPDLAVEQEAEWLEVQRQENLSSIEQLPLTQRKRLLQERKDYDQTIQYMDRQVLESLELLSASRFGLKEIFLRKLAGEDIYGNTVLEAMKSNGIDILEYPNQTDALDEEGSNVDIKFSEGNWHVRSNYTALNDPLEVLNKLIEIEALTPLLNGKTSLKKAIQAMPTQIGILLSSKKSLPESTARGLYKSQGKLHIPLIEKFYDIINVFGGGSVFIQNFTKLLSNQDPLTPSKAKT